MEFISYCTFVFIYMSDLQGYGAERRGPRAWEGNHVSPASKLSNAGGRVTNTLQTKFETVAQEYAKELRRSCAGVAEPIMGLRILNC